ncbi:MAG: O-antigen ligase family protein [Saprospiraceae bacterium]|nr:O-antigen ligase family protein [Saprospiraceae bacterium]
MTEKLKYSWVYGICAIFIVLNSVLIAYEFYWFSLIPVLALVVLMYFYALDKLLLLITFLTPISINIRDFDVGFGVSIPTEPLMAGVLLLFIIKQLWKSGFENKFLKHPVTVTLIVYLTWMFITSITSEYPLISFKFFISKLWFIIPFYFIGVQLFKNKKNINLFTWLYIIPLIGVVIYTTVRHASYGFDSAIAHWVMEPFFNDHTAYGAILAMFIPVSFGFIFLNDLSRFQKMLAIGAFVILMMGLYFSISRAAWISVAGAIGVFAIIKLRIKFIWVFSAVAIVVILFFSFQNQIIDKMAKNKQDSSADLAEHVKSISNITSDASNLERLNRWQSAIRMFKERPFWGWGPGTYQFIYAPFQLSKNKTIISTNAGNKGNAHSEYIGPLSESGVLGMMTFLAIIVAIVYTALRVYKRAADPRIRYLCLLYILGLFTYFVHGTLNNFLDTDKAAVPFWGFTAIIVAMDLYYEKRVEKDI